MRVNPFDKYLKVEDLEHIKTIRYLQEKHPEKLFFHIENEGKRTPFERYKSSLLGKRKGLPDIAIIHPKFSAPLKDAVGQTYNKLIYMALFIEIKAPEYERVVQRGKKEGKIVKNKAGQATPEQLEIISHLSKLKYKAVVCVGYDEAKRVIDDYFSL
jgi:hypothetical protein